MIPRKRLAKLHTTNVDAAAVTPTPTPNLTPTPSPSPSPLRILVPPLHNLPHWRPQSTRPKPLRVWRNGCDRAWPAHISMDIESQLRYLHGAAPPASRLTCQWRSRNLNYGSFGSLRPWSAPAILVSCPTSEVRDSVLNPNSADPLFRTCLSSPCIHKSRIFQPVKPNSTSINPPSTTRCFCQFACRRLSRPVPGWR